MVPALSPQSKGLSGRSGLMRQSTQVSATVYGRPWWLSWSRICLQCRRPRFNPSVGKILWRRNGCPLQYFCLENSMDRGAWQTTVHGVTESQDTTERLTLSISFHAITPGCVGQEAGKGWNLKEGQHLGRRRQQGGERGNQSMVRGRGYVMEATGAV